SRRRRLSRGGARGTRARREDSDVMTSASYVPRLEIEQQMLDAALGLSPRVQVLEGPRGAGKSSLLRQVASRLAAQGRRPVSIDIDRICISPADFARYLTDAVATALDLRDGPASGAGRIGRRLAEESTRRRPDPALLLDQALAFPEAAAQAGGPTPVLLLDELAEV